MNEVGSLASPFSYKIMPLAGEIWHITKISISMAHSSAGDLGKFGNITALTNGITYDALGVNVHIGNVGTTQYFKGNIKRINIFNRVLSVNEIVDIYNKETFKVR